MFRCAWNNRLQIFSENDGEANMKRNTRLFWSIVYFYIFFPQIIFFFGWTKLIFALPILCFVGFSFSSLRKNYSDISIDGFDIASTLIIVCILFLISYWSGVGGFVWQNSDHDCRNKIFELLVEEKWPVVMNASDGHDGIVRTAMLSYYIAFWLPAAVVGKCFGMTAGYAFQLIWLFVGLVIVFTLISSILNKWSINTLIVFLLFSGLDIMGVLFTKGTLADTPVTEHIEWWTYFQFSSNVTLIFWVFNQAIYAWIILLTIWSQRNNRHIALIYSCGLLSCTIPFVGMIPIVVYKFIGNLKIRDKNTCWKTRLLDCITVENVFGGGLIGFLSFFYLRGNSSAQVVTTSQPSHNVPYSLFLYVIAMLFEVGVYFIVLLRDEYKNCLFWIVVVTLLSCPLIRVGFGSDFCMRASIPSLLVLYLMYIKAISKAKENKKWNKYVLLIAILLIGGITPFHEVVRTGANTFEAIQQGAPFKTYASTNDVMGPSNFSSEVDNNFFYSYIARR